MPRPILKPHSYGVAFERAVTLRPNGIIVWAEFHDGYPPAVLAEFVRAIENAPDDDDDRRRAEHKARQARIARDTAEVERLGREVARLRRVRDSLAPPPAVTPPPVPPSAPLDYTNAA